MGALDCKVALISCIGRGIGRVAAHRFAAEGALVAGSDIDLSRAEDLSALSRVDRVDVTDEDSVRAWIRSTVDQLGRIDILYNNAGAVRFGRLDEQPYADWQFTLRAELDSVFLVSKAAWPYLAAARGVVINVGSAAGVAGSLVVGRVAHTAAKGAVIALTKQMAAEGGPLGIRVNAISPGLIRTEGTAESVLAPDSPMARAALHIPLGRMGGAEEVATVAVFLASPAAAYVTGANVMVDGGWSAVLNAPMAATVEG